MRNLTKPSARPIEALEPRQLFSVVTVTPMTVTESDTASSAVLTASLNAAAATDTTLTYLTVDGSAKAGSDYTAVSGSITIPAGSTSAAFSVPISADDISEGNEVFFIRLKGDAGTHVSRRAAKVTIVDNEAAPTVSIDDATIVEGAAGTTMSGAVTIKLSNPSSRPVTVVIATENFSAVAGRDYAPIHRRVVFRPGVTSVSVPVKVFGDDVAEQDEVFDILLVRAFNADLPELAGDRFSRVTIQDDDASAGTTVPTITVLDATAVEGEDVTFNVTLSAASSSDVSFRYATVAGTATAADYSADNGTITITAGETSATITIPTTADTVSEGDEQFTLLLSSPVNATLASTVATGTIQNSGTTVVTPSLSVASVSTTEGSSGTKTLTFTVTLSQAASSAVTVAYTTADGTATAGSDYVAASGTLTFAVGTTSKTVAVTVDGDTSVEADETLTLKLSSAVGATLANTFATGTITNDDSSSGTSTTDLSDNVSATSGGSESATGSTWLAASFETGSTGVTLASVRLLLSQAAAGSASVSIYSDDGLLEPGALVGTLTSPASYSSTLAETTFTASGITLAANTKYWVVLKAASGTFNWSWTSDTTGSGTGYTGEWGHTDDAGTSWFTDDAFPLQMNVNVT